MLANSKASGIVADVNKICNFLYAAKYKSWIIFYTGRRPMGRITRRMRAMAGKIQQICFKYLDAPIEVVGAENMPAIPLNATLEHTMLPIAEKVKERMEMLLEF